VRRLYAATGLPDQAAHPAGPAHNYVGLQGRLLDVASIEGCPGHERQESRPHIATSPVVHVLTCSEGKCSSVLLCSTAGSAC